MFEESALILLVFAIVFTVWGLKVKHSIIFSFGMLMFTTLGILLSATGLTTGQLDSWGAVKVDNAWTGTFTYQTLTVQSDFVLMTVSIVLILIPMLLMIGSWWFMERDIRKAFGGQHD
jgi:hypothetical protein